MPNVDEPHASPASPVRPPSSGRLPSLDRLAVFDAAARHLSFTRAAAELFITQSAVSRQIAALEDEIGAPLFRRRHRALDLSDDGRRLAAATAEALAGLRGAVAAIRGPLAKGRREVITLTTTPGLASLWLIPRLADFTGAHPGVDVRIDASHDVRALASEGFDLAIRYVRSVPAAEPDAAARGDGDGTAPPAARRAGGGTPLFQEWVQPVCSPLLLQRGPPLVEPADLRHHTLLDLAMAQGSGMPAEWRSWLAAVGAEHVEPRSVLSFSAYDAAVGAAVAGQGVVLGRRPLVDGLLRDGLLVAPFAGESTSVRGYSLMVSAAAARRPAVQALFRWLLEQAEPARQGHVSAATAGPRRGQAASPAAAPVRVAGAAPSGARPTAPDSPAAPRPAASRTSRPAPPSGTTAAPRRR